jgi:hypothetical protein
MPIPLSFGEDLMEDDDETEELYELEEADEPLDHLLKHALKNLPEDSNAGHIWKQLADRVRGPFGVAALEAPAYTSFEAEIMATGGRAYLAPFALSDKARKPRRQRREAIDLFVEMLRSDQSGRTQPAGALMFM